MDGSKIHADVFKHPAVSYKRLVELETQLRQKAQALLTLGEQADHGERVLPEGLVVDDEVTRRQERLAKLAKPKRFWKPAPPAADASLRVKMAHKLPTGLGRAIYRLRKMTVEPVIGLSKEVLGFRQFSRRGL